MTRIGFIELWQRHVQVISSGWKKDAAWRPAAAHKPEAERNNRLP